MGSRALDLRDGRSVLDLLPFAVIVADLDGSATYANRTWTTITGQNPAWKGLGWLDVLERDDRDSERERLVAAIEAGARYDADWVVTARGGEERVLHLSAVLDPRDGEAAGMVVSATDVTADRAHMARLLVRATHDPLTGLVNRSHFLEFVGHALDRLRRPPGQPAAVFFVDVDGLKTTNDLFGHDAGDRLLQQVADCISGAVRPADIVARHGGDEFTVLCEELPDIAEASAIRERIRDAARHPRLGDSPCKVSIGFAIADDPNADPGELVDIADRDMYDQRRRERGRRLHLVTEPQPERRARRGPVDLADVVAVAVQTAQPPDDVSVRVRHRRAIPPVTVVADGATLCRLVVELLTNAYRAGGTHVTISITPEVGTDQVRLAVEDDGVTAHTAGLPLALAEQLAESVGGTLDHRPTRPHGARFTLTLPQALPG